MKSTDSRKGKRLIRRRPATSLMDIPEFSIFNDAIKDSMLYGISRPAGGIDVHTLASYEEVKH